MTKIYLAIIGVAVVLCFGLPGHGADSLSDAEKMNQVHALNHQSVELMNAGKLQESRALLEQACLQDPNVYSNATHMNLGVVLQKLGDLQSAKDQFLIALRFDANSGQTLYNLARCYMAMGDNDNSIASWKNFLDKDPNGSHSTVARQVLLSLQAKALLDQEDALRAQGKRKESHDLLESECHDLTEKASALDPSEYSAGTHANLALTLKKLGDLELARDQYIMALRFDPNRAQTWYQLGDCYSLLGDINNSIGSFNEFLKREPNGQYADRARNILALQENARLSDNPHGSDYFMGAISRTNQQIERWSFQNQPIKVFIESGEGVIGYQPCFRQALTDAFDKWTGAINNRLFCKLVADRQSADIVCRWASDRSNFPNPTGFEQGETSLHYLPATMNGNAGLIDKCDVIICITDTVRQRPMTCDEVQFVCLHEIGHALGIVGHSSASNDVMFARATDTPVTELSQRDKATIARLYFTN